MTDPNPPLDLFDHDEPSSPSRRAAQEWEYRVRYIRKGWPHFQSRIFQSLPPAVRLLGKLRHPSWEWDHLERIVEVRVQRRRVGEWEDISTRSLTDIYQGRRR